MDEKLIPKGLHYCYSDGVWDGKVFRTKNCPYWKHTDHGTVKCEFLGVESLTIAAGEYEDKMRELAYKHFGSEEAALEATEEGWLLWDQLKICGINVEE